MPRLFGTKAPEGQAQSKSWRRSEDAVLRGLTWVLGGARLAGMMKSEDTLRTEGDHLGVSNVRNSQDGAPVPCARDFSHVGNFTGYMAVVLRILEKEKPLKILDMPAGNGLLADRLRRAGHMVVCTDINRERPDYVLADMNEARRNAQPT